VIEPIAIPATTSRRLDAGGITWVSTQSELSAFGKTSRRLDAGGITWGSRWLSAATPPDPVPPKSAPRQGCYRFSACRYPLASLRDADSFAIRGPVVSLAPRSTTGYRMKSLRDDHASSFSLSK